MSGQDRSAAQGQRDPFADDVLERLARSNMEYQREHGHYIVPLAERLLAVRAALRDLVEAEWMVTHDWGGDREAVLRRAYEALGKGLGSWLRICERKGCCAMASRSNESPAAKLRRWFRPGGFGPLFLVFLAVYIYFAVTHYG